MSLTGGLIPIGGGGGGKEKSGKKPTVSTSHDLDDMYDNLLDSPSPKKNKNKSKNKSSSRNKRASSGYFSSPDSSPHKNMLSPNLGDSFDEREDRYNLPMMTSGDLDDSILGGIAGHKSAPSIKPLNKQLDKPIDKPLTSLHRVPSAGLLKKSSNDDLIDDLGWDDDDVKIDLNDSIQSTDFSSKFNELKVTNRSSRKLMTTQDSKASFDWLDDNTDLPSTRVHRPSTVTGASSANNNNYFNDDDSPVKSNIPPLSKNKLSWQDTSENVTPVMSKPKQMEPIVVEKKEKQDDDVDIGFMPSFLESGGETRTKRSLGPSSTRNRGSRLNTPKDNSGLDALDQALGFTPTPRATKV